MYDAIKEIREAVGNEKQKVMADHPELKTIFEYAYNPFKRYYMTAPNVYGHYLGVSFSGIHFILLDQLCGRAMAGQAAKNKVAELISKSSNETAAIFKMIIDKDLKVGVGVRTINKVWPGLIPYSKDGATDKPAIMLVKNFNAKKIKYPCVAAYKKDGVRGRIITNEIFTRANHRVHGVEHIEDELADYDFELDGELMVPGCNFDTASGRIRDHSPLPDAVYWIFDCPDHHGNKIERFQFLRNSVIERDHIKIIPHVLIQNEWHLQLYYEHALRHGNEGIVIYSIDHQYRDARSYDWMRMVPIKSADCRCIGFFKGKGKHAGSLGGIIVSYKDEEIKIGTGFSEKFDEKRALKIAEARRSKEDPTLNTSFTDVEKEMKRNIRSIIWAHQDQFIDRIAKIEYKELTAKGSFRQPRFKGWRWDKEEGE